MSRFLLALRCFLAVLFTFRLPVEALRLLPAPEVPPPGYFTYQNAFTYADLILAALLAKASGLLGDANPVRKRFGYGLSLVCAGALLFLGGLDITFNMQNGIYGSSTVNTLREGAINLWCIGFGLLSILAFLPRLSGQAEPID